MPFPSPPLTPGTPHEQGGAHWEWDGTKWIARGGAGLVTASFVPVSAITHSGQTLGANYVQDALQMIFQMVI